MRVALLLAYVRYACASVDQVEGSAGAGRRVVGRFRRLADGGGSGEVVVAAAEGVVSTVAAGVGAGGERGRRLPRRVVNLSAALRRRRGRYYFLLSSLSPLPPAPSHPPFGPSVSLHALVVSVALPRTSGTTSSKWRVLFSSRLLPRVPSFHSARLNTLPVLRSVFVSFFVRSLARLPRSRDLAFDDRSCVYTRSLVFFLFLPLRMGKQSARCLLSSHSACLLTRASCSPRSIFLVACA